MRSNVPQHGFEYENMKEEILIAITSENKRFFNLNCIGFLCEYDNSMEEIEKEIIKIMN